MKLKVFLVDDERLAIKRLARLLNETNRVEIVGQTTESANALKIIPNLNLDAIFLDIQMPDLTGFELLRALKRHPPVIFTTAFDEFALRAFDVHSVDYLLKPIEPKRLKIALDKLEKLAGSDDPSPNIENLLKTLTTKRQETTERIASRIGGKVQILDINEITHFFAQDKLTFAKTFDNKEFPLDDSLNNLEKKLDTKTFLRVHRSSIVNLNFIDQVHGWFSGKVLIRMKGTEKTEIVVARNRVKVLKEILGM